jgi:branched-chain amino acid transport system ATP-binding protein
MDSGAMLEVVDVHACYEGVEVLHGIDLKIKAGTVTAVLGPNGAGKSTLMSVIAGLHSPTEGEVNFEGERVTANSAARLARRGLCLVPEGRGVFPNLTVRENLWVMTHSGVNRSDIEDRAYVRFPRLAERRNQPAGSLSGGEQQMLAMARAVSTSPKLLILDELSMGLAPIIVDELYRHVAELSNEGATVLVVEQFARIALSVATSGAVMVGGRIVHAGPSHEIEAILHSAYLGSAAEKSSPDLRSLEDISGDQPEPSQRNGTRPLGI